MNEAHTYATINNNDDCPVCNQAMYSTDMLGSVFIDGKRLLGHWGCRMASITSKPMPAPTHCNAWMGPDATCGEPVLEGYWMCKAHVDARKAVNAAERAEGRF